MDHWKQPDKGRQQQQQQHLQHTHNHSHKNQSSKTTSDYNSQQQQQQQQQQQTQQQLASTDPIQSIANVLNHHSKFVQHQKKSQQLEEQASKNKLDQQSSKGSTFAHNRSQQQQQKVKQKSGAAAASSSSAVAAVAQDRSGSPFGCSHGFSQVDQGNSYLYAYNDFVTSSARGPDTNLELHNGAVLRASGVKIIDDSCSVEGHGKVCSHGIPAISLASEFNHRHHHHNHFHTQESLIESDEDDALSYILHQHRSHQHDPHHLHELRCLNNHPGNNSHKYLINEPSGSNNNNNNQYFNYEEGVGSFEEQRIDHHLSCSRSSHPRHICGIGGSHNDKLNNIAARLREESQRAFVLNQKQRNTNYTTDNGRQLISNNDLAAIQARQFTHDLNIIHDQLTGQSSLDVDHQYNEHSENIITTSAPKTGYLSLSNELHLTSSENNPAAAFDRQALLLAAESKSGGSSSGEIVNDSLSDNLSRPISLVRQASSSKQQARVGFFAWLFACLCSLLCISSSSHKKQGKNQSSKTASQRKRRNKSSVGSKRTNESSVVSMYTSSQQVSGGGGVGQLGGQAGAYYATQTPQNDAAALHHQSYSLHHGHHHHHYPLSSDSSLGSSAFANSAMRMNAFFKNCCSKKCLFIFCLAFILLIFIFVIGLSAYLNFLINSNKTNLLPLSGRLKVETQGDSFSDQLSNRTSKEFLSKQQQYETILRGAFDRAQNLLKSYPNHLVKCEVYSFKQGSLWVYFRLFINKKTLMQDTQLMKRKSPDEHMDKQFLPRLTQQTLHSGFEQLMIAFNRDLSISSASASELRRTRTQTTATNTNTPDPRQPRAIPLQEIRSVTAQRDHVKSFDEQISRLMPIIESIDLQSIQVTPEFDMLQSLNANLALQQQSMSDNLRASQFLTTSPSTVMVATGTSNKNLAEYDIAPTATPDESSFNSSGNTSTASTRQQQTETEISTTQTGGPDEISVSTKKFTLYGYKENATRPTTSSRPVVVAQNRAQDQSQNNSSLFLVNQQRKPASGNQSLVIAKINASSNGGDGGFKQQAREDSTTNGIASSSSTTTSTTTTTTSTTSTAVPSSSFKPVIDSQASNSKEKIVKLVSGQPVISQNNLQRGITGPSRNSEDKPSASLSASNKNLTLFAPFNKQDQFTGFSSVGNFSSSFRVPDIVVVGDDIGAKGNVLQKDNNHNSNNNNNNNNKKLVNETVVIGTMVAPYQKIEFSNQQPNNAATVMNVGARRPPTQETSIQDLWNNALSNNNKKNFSTKVSEKLEGSEQQSSQPKRLITVTTIGGKNQDFTLAAAATPNNNSALDWHKISVLSSDTMRTQSQNATSLTMTSSTSPAAAVVATLSSVSSQKPKVSPHLKQGGSLISTPPATVVTAGPRPQQEIPQSAVILNRDFHAANSEGQVVSSSNGLTNGGSTSRQVTPKLSPTRSDRVQQQQVQRKAQLNGQRNNTSTSQAGDISHKPQRSRPAMKQHKVKKVTDLSSVAKNVTTNGALISGTNRTAGGTGESFFSTTTDSSKPSSFANLTSASNNVQQRQAKNKTQEAFNFNADHMVPTLPTTIELTRSTSASPPLRTTQSGSLNDHRAASSVDYTTTTTTTTSSGGNQKISNLLATTTESPIRAAASTSSEQAKPTNTMVTPTTISNSPTADRSPLSALQSVVLSGQLTRPGTTSFSNQWRPMATVHVNNSTHQEETRTSTRRPNVPLIISVEKPSPTINVPSTQGSQSPFAMSPAILENQLRPAGNRNSLSQNVPRRLNKLSNTYHPLNTGANNNNNNEFESHRMSRMRNGGEHSGGSGSNLFASPQASTTSTTTSSLNLDSSTRIVDDFMITTDKIDENAHASTFIPPTISNNGAEHNFDTNLPKARSSPSASIQPKRTRGPFAFETLRATTSSLTPSSNINLGGDSATSDSLLMPSRAERSPVRLTSVGADQKLLVRKKLFLGDEELNFSPSTNNPAESGSVVVDVNKVPIGETLNSDRLQPNSSIFDPFGNRKSPGSSLDQLQQHPVNLQIITGENYFPGNQSYRCPYYGCKAKGSLKFTCLNYSQICDDFIDCQDESDELDCVSLLKHDSKSNKLSFSNGGGIIYLNRKGSLAPMCIDYFGDTDSQLISSSAAVASATGAHLLDVVQLEVIKKQQELIKQINTIGQYACSLQSFSRLVSVKINHHSLVDNLDLIKSSKLYHRLSIISDLDDKSGDSNLGSSFRSGGSDHEVEVSTSDQCPSQRTVFVKCGGFECGQDSFSIIDQNNSAKRKGGIIINDFPWLVKLYWLGSLSCHGYLIDELWLITSSECFANKSRVIDDKNGWTAEISYEHYGNYDYQSIESNRRSIKEILTPPNDSNNKSVESSIVLAKLEKPVRFSPLNRPICLPSSSKNKTADSAIERTYKDCVTATLPLAINSTAPTQDLILNKVRVHRSADCLRDEDEIQLKSNGRADDLVCVVEVARNDGGLGFQEDDATRVLICSTNQASRSRSKWTVVGVQNKALGLRQPDANKRLFTSVSSQIDWIVDTMNPKSYPNLHPEGHNSNNNNPIGNELNPISSLTSQNQACSQFKCYSGECLSWSRICDGLYDCSSHDDEKDCHK